MRRIFDSITRLSLRFRWITLAATLALIGLGAYSYTKLNQELIPAIEFPQTFIFSQNGGASSDNMLHMYGIPIEQAVDGVDGVVNTEATSRKGISFVIVRNEFGLQQSRIVDDIQAEIDAIPLPVRRLEPTSDMSVQDMVRELGPEHLAWLYTYAGDEDIAFEQQLDADVWASFSDEALLGFPEDVFETLESIIREDILARRSGATVASPDEPPVLPSSWSQQDPRFRTVADLAEMASTRNLAAVFNDFIEDGYVVGPLVHADDLSQADVQLFIEIENSCRDFRQRTGTLLPTDGSDPCSYIAYLDAEVILATFGEDGTVADWLPQGYLADLAPRDRNTLAQAALARDITGQEVPRSAEVELPDAWQAEAPQLLTFSLSDFALGAITISSSTLTDEELREYVEDDFVPRLKDLGLIADVRVVGGETIPSYVLNPELERVNLPTIDTNNNTTETDTSETGDDESDNENQTTDESTDAASGSDENECQLEPPVETDLEPVELPAPWALLPSFFGAEGFELTTTAHLVDLSYGACQYASSILNLMTSRPEAIGLITQLPEEAFVYLAAVEPNFLDNLNSAVIDILPEDIVRTLLRDYDARLGSSWEQLSSQDEMMQAGQRLTHVSDLVDYEGKAAQTLVNVVSFLHNGQFRELGDFCGLSREGFCEFAVLLINDLSSFAIEGIIDREPDFLTALASTESGQVVLSYFSQDAMKTTPVATFIDNLDDENLQQVLQAIRDGERLTAAESLQAERSAERIVDDSAPDLPSSWSPVGGFVGTPLERADDLLNVKLLPNYESAADFINFLSADPQGQNRIRELQFEAWDYLGNVQTHEEGFWSQLSTVTLRILASADFVDQLPPTVQERIAAGGEPFEPDEFVTRTNANSSLIITVFKDKDANTVASWDEVEAVLEDVRDDIDVFVPFEQSTFIEESLAGVQREGLTGAIMAIIVILVFMNLSIRSTLVTSVSIPTSVMTAFFLMEFVPSNVYALLSPILDDVGRDSTLGSLLEVIIRLFPESYTLNIMTLSGLTVAIGRVVDDSIVVLENIYRNIQKGGDQREAILQGTREVSVAIFAATLTTMVVFLPLGLFGGVVGAFFLPFGLAVTYSLAGSYIVAITTVPALAQIFITKETIPAEGQIEITDEMAGFERGLNHTKNAFISGVDRLSAAYSIAIQWVLRNRLITIGIALASLFFGMYLLGNRPQQFLPNFGDPTIAVSVNLPAETEEGQPITVAYTDVRVRQLEAYLQQSGGEIESILTSVGGDALSGDFLGGTGELDETIASIQIGMPSQEALDAFLPELRTEAEAIFGSENVQVSGASTGGGFGGFALELSGPEGTTLQDLATYDDIVLETLGEIDGLVNIESTLAGAGDEGETTYIRVDGIPAIRYTAELESEDALGITAIAIEKVEDAVAKFREEHQDTLDLSAEITVGQGFESEQQVEGFRQIGVSMLIATFIVYLLLVFTFGHAIHPITILVSLPLSVVGAAVALTITGRALGLSAMIGLLMLIGIVVTNAVVLLDRVQQNRRERGMSTYDALVEAGRVRLRPILMTAISTTFGVLPLALGFTEGAIIAAELGTVVIGGLVSSTFLTLLVVPVVYSLFDSLIQTVLGIFGRGSKSGPLASPATD